jgi:hypothetical protein
MIVAASTTLSVGSRSGRNGGRLPWTLLVAGSVVSLAANVAVAELTLVGRVIAASPRSPRERREAAMRSSAPLAWPCRASVRLATPRR